MLRLPSALSQMRAEQRKDQVRQAGPPVLLSPVLGSRHPPSSLAGRASVRRPSSLACPTPSGGWYDSYGQMLRWEDSPSFD